MILRPYKPTDLSTMVALWNEVVAEGKAFPQIEVLDLQSGRGFFAAQTRSVVAADDGEVLGLYILHPNNVGRCAHIANASYAVASHARGRGIGRALVLDSLQALRPCGFRGLQFNAVVASNAGAIHLYEDLGFIRIGTIGGGFRNGDDVFEDIHIYYHDAL